MKAFLNALFLVILMFCVSQVVSKSTVNLKVKGREIPKKCMGADKASCYFGCIGGTFNDCEKFCCS